MADVDELKDQLHKVELAMANLAGEVRSLRELKAQDHEHIRSSIADVDHKRRTTDAAVKALHQRLDQYPKPEVVNATVDEFRALKNRLLGGIVVGMALGVGSGTAISQLFLGS